MIKRDQNFVNLAILSASVEDGFMMAFDPNSDPFDFSDYGKGRKRKWDIHLAHNLGELVEAGLLYPHSGSALYIPTEDGVQLIEESLVPRLHFMNTLGLLEAGLQNHIMPMDECSYNFQQVSDGSIFTETGHRWQEYMVSDFEPAVNDSNTSLLELWETISLESRVLSDEALPELCDHRDHFPGNNCIPQAMKRVMDVRRDLVRPLEVDYYSINHYCASTIESQSTDELFHQIADLWEDLEDIFG